MEVKTTFQFELVQGITTIIKLLDTKRSYQCAIRLNHNPFFSGQLYFLRNEINEYKSSFKAQYPDVPGRTMRSNNAYTTQNHNPVQKQILDIHVK